MPELTRILQQLAEGAAAPDEPTITALYDEVRALARSCMRSERDDHTLVPTALANEAWLRLFGAGKPGFAGRAEFFAAAATTLRRILVEHSRARGRQKRGGAMQRSELEADALAAPEGEQLLELDAALARLAAFDPHKAKLVELRFFAGLSVAESAAVLGMSERTVARDWRVARAFLQTQLDAAGGGLDLDR